MQKPLIGIVLLAVLPALAIAQESERDSPSRGGVLNIGFDGYGLSIGNSRRWSGLRINFRDRHVEYVNGINITLWQSKENETARYNGLSLGIGPVGGEFNGVTVGILGALANRRMRGINLGGLGLVSNGDVAGINLGGLGTVADGNMRGINVGGLGLVSQ